MSPRPFLQHVAASLRAQFGTDLSRTVVVFPGRRAGLFLSEHLTDDTCPVWAPHYLSISELLQSLAPRSAKGERLVVADKIESVCRIYHLYREATGDTDETLDHFYGWGERILSDFDDIDKNLAFDTAPERVFRDVADYATTDINDDGLLNEEEAEQFRRFVSDFDTKEQTVLRQRFLRLWHALPKIYRQLGADLLAEGQAYEGQLFRLAVTNLEERKVDVRTALGFPIEHIAFVGFNVLDEVERRLFSFLKEEHIALFYWDYDRYYTEPFEGRQSEAGEFLVRNLQQFPNELTDTALFDNFLRSDTATMRPRLTYIAADTDSAQAAYVRQWLETPGNVDPQHPNRTAVVLCDEGLLQSVLHALPEGLPVNVTNGFPLSQTPAYTFLSTEMDNRLRELHTLALKQGTAASAPAEPSAETLVAELDRLQRHLEDKARASRLDTADDEWFHVLYEESYFQAYTTLTRFADIVRRGWLAVSPATLFRLVRAVLRTAAIPFHGEPAEGLQVMGVLETRALDFDHVLLLSVGDGILPQRASDASFIPYILRRYYGLTTAEHRTAVYAYYFHRLLQRTTTATLLYNASTQMNGKGEMSRFMRALLVDPRIERGIHRACLDALPAPTPFDSDRPLPALSHDRPAKTSFSPTALNTYLSCARSFYYKYVVHIKKPRAAAEIIDVRDFGTVFHRAAELLFFEVLTTDEGQQIKRSTLKALLEEKNDALLTSLVRRAFADCNEERTLFTEAGVKKYLKTLIAYEAGTKSSPAPAEAFRALRAEEEISTELTVPFGPEKRPVTLTIAGTADRIDLATLAPGESPRLRIIDYKTGGTPHLKLHYIEDVFTAEKTDRPKYAFQAMLYAFIVGTDPKYAEWAGHAITPALYHVNKFNDRTFSPYLLLETAPKSKEYVPIDDARPHLQAFADGLTELLAQIINPDNPFNLTDVEDNCKNCDFKALCGR